MRQISKLPRDTGITGWNAVLGAAPAYPEAEGDITADWLVIGGGFAGLSAAKRLTELLIIHNSLDADAYSAGEFWPRSPSRPNSF